MHLFRHFAHTGLLILLLITCLPFSAPSASVDVPPAALEAFMGRKIATTMHWSGAGWLIRDSREREEATIRMIEHLGIQAGQTVCDLGCGNGYHSLLLADRVGPTGRVLAVDIQPKMLTLLTERARERGVTPIETILGSVTDPRLPAGETDLILLVDVYHEFSHPLHMLEKIRAALAPGGRVVLVEFRAEDKSVPIKPEHKMERSQILLELIPHGFRLVHEVDDLPWQHMLFFEATPPRTAQ